MNAKDKYGNTPLMLAASHGQDDSVTLLIEAKADIEVKNIFDETATTLAARNGHIKTVGLLIAAGANYIHQDIVNRLLDSGCNYKHAGIVKMLIDAGADIMSKASAGRYEMDDIDRALVAKVREAISYQDDGNPAKDVIDEGDMIDAMRLLLQVIDAGGAA